MNVTAVINGCTIPYPGEPERQWEDLLSLLENSPDLLPENGTAVILHDAGSTCDTLAAATPFPRAICISMPRYTPEAALSALQTLHKEQSQDLYLFPSNPAGSELAVRLAFRLGGSSLTWVNRLTMKDDDLQARRAVYASHLEGVFTLPASPWCVSSARGSRVSSQATETEIVSTSFVTESENSDPGIFTPSEKHATLETARFIVAAGQGAGSQTGIEQLQQHAAGMCAEFGVSRNAAMQAWAPMERLIGASGVITSPEVCIAAGVSGAAAFCTGIEKSAFIAAVNTDPTAPIAAEADVTVVEDCLPFMEALTAIISADRENQRQKTDE